MPAEHTLHVVLTETLLKYARDKVAGHHPITNHLVRDSLRKLMERDYTWNLQADASRQASPDG